MWVYSYNHTKNCREGARERDRERERDTERERETERKRERASERARESKYGKVHGHPVTSPLHLVSGFSKKGGVSWLKDCSTLYCQSKLADVKLGDETVKVGHEAAL